jgi:hypothetical protein
MMERDIVHKLTEELAQNINSERQVVYILIEIRKLLEKEEALEKFPDLKLCCDCCAPEAGPEISTEDYDALRPG